MDFNKLRNISNRPLDYLKERQISSYIPNKSSFGITQIGWESTRLRENSSIKGNHKDTILHLDAWKKNNFTGLSGKFSKNLDKELGMERGFPFHKLDLRRQKRLVKNADIIQSKLSTGGSALKTITPRESEASFNSSRRAKSQIKYYSVKKSPMPQKRFISEIKKTTKDLYDKIYEEKLKSHFVTPYPKFPYNLDKDTINLTDPAKTNPRHHSTHRKTFCGKNKLKPMRSPGTNSKIEYYKNDATEKFSQIQKEILARTLDNRKKKGSIFNDFSKSYKDGSKPNHRRSIANKSNTSRKRSISKTNNYQNYEKKMERVYKNPEKI
ncbi:unnamed protein product [Moneuplotes crassus]|uniref:Uncharacterized protein n=1 Tax=Euplotes crassus TaxID=5936 RepID=A0AAD1XMZ2_EUPCR|nr:unnamed protein product [Moneuplotes crassus]